MAAAATLVVADIDGMKVAETGDPFSHVFAHAVAAKVLELRLDFEKAKARTWIAEYGAAQKRGEQRRNSRTVRGRRGR